MEANNMVP